MQFSKLVEETVGRSVFYSAILLCMKQSNLKAHLRSATEIQACCNVLFSQFTVLLFMSNNQVTHFLALFPDSCTLHAIIERGPGDEATY